MMQLSHVTLADDSLTHQVRFTTYHGGLYVSCNCRRTIVNETFQKLHTEAIGRYRDLDEARKLYNDPANHWKPFSKEDESRW